MNKGQMPGAPDEREARRRRLAEALRENLTRRKTQARARTAGPEAGTAPVEPSSERD